MMVAFGLKFRT